MDISRITLFLLVAFLSCSESSLIFGNDFQRCQQSYDRNIGTLVAEEGMDSVSSIWRILFNNLDLNRNGLLSASEIVLAFETRNLATKEELSLVLSQTQSWIDTKNTDGGNSELNLSGFRDLLSNTMGRMREKSPTRKMWEDFLLLMCRFVNQEIPVVVNSFRDLKNCTDAIKNDQLSSIADDDAKKMILNIWKAVFKTIDGNNDDVLDSDDIRLAINQYAVQDNTTEDTTNPVDLYTSGSLTRSHFFGRINNLLFGAAEGNLWQRIETLSDLNGNKTFCSLLRHVWNDMERALEGNEECRLSYMEQLESTLGNDGKAAPAIIFTYLDKNKDGIVTSSELNNDQMADTDFPGPLDVANMTSLLPDEVVEVRSQNQSGKMEMSLLSLAEQRTWNLFCKLTTQVLSRYPGNQDQSGGITETDAVEFLLQRANESRLSASENLQQLYEVLHGLYEVQTTTTTESTSTTAGTTTESIPTTAGTTTESIPTTAGTTTESIPTTVGTTTESILTTAGTTTESTPTTATVPSPIPNNETESTTQFINEMVELDQILQLIISNDTTVNDVISDGEITTGPNSSTSDTSQDGNTTGANQNDQSEDRTNEISKEERELFNLINTYHEQHTKAKKRIEDELTRKLDSSKSSAEEVQLQKLLIKAMKAET